MFNLLKRNLMGPPATLDVLDELNKKARDGQRRLQLKAELCRRCGACAEACPTGSLVLLHSDGVLTADSAGCIDCGRCAKACPHSALDRQLVPISAASEREQLSVALERETSLPALFSAKTNVFSRSFHIRHVDCGSCNGCDWEMTTLNNPIYDIQRYGLDFVASPRHADAVMVTGPVTRHLEQALLRTLESVPEPKRVIAVGSCACGGGVLGGTYAAHRGVEDILPVDVFIPGCPPRPLALIYGLLLAKQI